MIGLLCKPSGAVMLAGNWTIACQIYFGRILKRKRHFSDHLLHVSYTKEKTSIRKYPECCLGDGGHMR